MKKVISGNFAPIVVGLCIVFAISTAFVSRNAPAEQCTATAKSTGKQCKNTVSDKCEKKLCSTHCDQCTATTKSTGKQCKNTVSEKCEKKLCGSHCK